MRLAPMLVAFALAACASDGPAPRLSPEPLAAPSGGAPTLDPTPAPAASAGLGASPSSSADAAAPPTEQSSEPGSPPRSGTGTARSEAERFADEVCACQTKACVEATTSRWKVRLDARRAPFESLPPKEKEAFSRGAECALALAIE